MRVDYWRSSFGSVRFLQASRRRTCMTSARGRSGVEFRSECTRGCQMMEAKSSKPASMLLGSSILPDALELKDGRIMAAHQSTQHS